MNDATRAANLKTLKGSDDNLLAIYDDGLILYLACSEQTARAVSQELAEAEVTFEEGRSDDGLYSCWICRGLKELGASLLLWQVIGHLDIIKVDQRQSDHHLIDHFLELLK